MSKTIVSNESADAENILETRGITKSFRGITAVDGVDYEVKAGKLQAIIGPNGAGKSTFFKLLTGVLTPDSGTIYYRGEDITDMERHERVQQGISMKFQNVRVFSNMSVRDNMRVPLLRQNPDDLEERVDDLLTQINLANRGKEEAGNLAHGEKQWLEIAMAIAVEPNLLLLDEPTAGMTIEETDKTGELIEKLVAEEEVTVIIVEHDIRFIQAISEWITVLHNGEILTEGEVKDIIEDPEVRRVYLEG